MLEKRAAFGGQNGHIVGARVTLKRDLLCELGRREPVTGVVRGACSGQFAGHVVVRGDNGDWHVRAESEWEVTDGR